MDNKETPTVTEKKESPLKPSPGTKVCIISKKELEELKRTNKLKQTDPTKSPNVFLIKQQLCDKLRTSEPNKKFVLKHVVRTKSAEGPSEKKPVFQIVQQKTGAGNSKEDNGKESPAEHKKGLIFKTKIISNSKVKVPETDIKKIFTNNSPKLVKRFKVDDDDVKFKPNGRPAKTYLRNPETASLIDSPYDKEKNESANLTPIKRRRGRPRKNETRRSIDDDASTDDEDWSPNKSTAKKRRRSHRKKAYDDEEDEDDMWSSYQEEEDDEEEDERSSAVEEEDPLNVKSPKSDEDKPKRKRGRPPKQQLVVEEDNKPSVDSASADENNSPPAKIPKKRGRPRKSIQIEKSPSPQPEEDEKVKSEEVSSADETLPTTRRRSRKNINYFELANPKSFDEWADDGRQSEKNEKTENSNVKDTKRTTKVTKIVITEKRVTPGYVEIDFCAKDLNEQDHEIVEQEKNKNNSQDDDMEVEEASIDSSDKEKAVQVIKSSEDGKSGENGEVIYVIQQIDSEADGTKVESEQTTEETNENEKVNEESSVQESEDSKVEEAAKVESKENETGTDTIESQENIEEAVESKDEEKTETEYKKTGATTEMVGTLFEQYKKDAVGDESSTTTLSNW